MEGSGVVVGAGGSISARAEGVGPAPWAPIHKLGHGALASQDAAPELAHPEGLWGCLPGSWDGPLSETLQCLRMERWARSLAGSALWRVHTMDQVFPKAQLCVATNSLGQSENVGGAELCGLILPQGCACSGNTFPLSSWGEVGFCFCKYMNPYDKSLSAIHVYII